MLVIAGTIPVDPARIDDVIAAAVEMQRATLQEPGCRMYQFSVAVGDPSTVCIMEEWDDQASLEAHFVAPHMAAFQGSIAGVVTGAMDVSKYEVSSKGPVR